jgi:hypothetical protein
MDRPNCSAGYLDYLKQTEGLWNNRGRSPLQLLWKTCGSPIRRLGGMSLTHGQQAAARAQARQDHPRLTQLQDVKESQISDPTNCVVCGDPPSA